MIFPQLGRILPHLGRILPQLCTILSLCENTCSGGGNSVKCIKTNKIKYQQLTVLNYTLLLPYRIIKCGTNVYKGLHSCYFFFLTQNTYFTKHTLSDKRNVALFTHNDITLIFSVYVLTVKVVLITSRCTRSIGETA